MTKEEFKQQREELSFKVDHLRRELEGLTRRYIRESAPFVIGEKVKVVTPQSTFLKQTMPERVEYGFVIGYDVDMNGKLCPLLKNVKKDGTIGNRRVYIGYGVIVEKI